MRQSTMIHTQILKYDNRMNKDFEYTFDKEFAKACHTSFNFQQCFKDYKVEPLFKNGKKLGAIVSKSKL